LHLHFFTAASQLFLEKMQMQMPQTGEQLTFFRECKFWSQATLAEELGVATTTIWRWERMQRLPKSAQLRFRRWVILNNKANPNRQPHEPTIGLVPNAKRGRPRLDQF
jgi:DNA-binding transcriptional regulator YiaG